ncbi:MAG: LLM class flavin-dependent oxidoreductase [Promethearchaeota archaeon]
MKSNQIKFGIYTPPRGIEWIYQTAFLAEKLNYDSVWMPDHLVGWGKNTDSLDPWTVMTAVGVKTKRIKIGIGVTDPHRRHPAILAQMSMTMEKIFGDNRLIIGIGAGESMNLDAYGIKWNKPVSRLEEFIKIIKGLHKKKSFKLKGEFYNLKRASISPKPKKIPIFVAGNRPRTRKITGELGDGWFPFKINPETYKKDLNEVFKAASGSGRDINEITPSLLLYTVISKNTEDARKIIQKQGKILLMVSPNKLKNLGFETTNTFDATKPNDRAKMAEEFKKIEDVPDEILDEVFVYGTPDDCIKKIENYIKAGCKYFVIGLLNPGKEREEGITTYSDKVISYLQENY